MPGSGCAGHLELQFEVLLRIWDAQVCLGEGAGHPAGDIY